MNVSLERVFIDRYGYVPSPTPGEQMRYELLVDSGTYWVEQEKRDALRLAGAAVLLGDEETATVALNRWNAVTREMPYRRVDLLVACEDGNP